MDLNHRSLRTLATTIRMLSADAVEQARSGHPGMPMGAADYAALLWAYFLRFDPRDPEWPARDRFILSAGHGSMLLYALLHLFGFDLSLADIKRFRQWGSRTPGHPEFGVTPGVETTTGPLGQGFANGVGVALSSKMLAERYQSPLFNYRVFGIVSDGDLMEGVASEAASLAGHLGLDNIVYIYDQNRISIGGSTDLTFTEDVSQRFEAYGWFVQSADGHDFDQMSLCLGRAAAESERPSLICARTTIGLGSPNKGGSSEVHGAPLGADELAKTKDFLEWPREPSFHVPDGVKEFCAELTALKAAKAQAWYAEFAEWQKQHPDAAQRYQTQRAAALPAELKEELLQKFGSTPPDATRNLSGKVLQVLAKHLPGLVGGSADLEPSTKTLIADSADIAPRRYGGRNIRFGVREHAMGAVVNGLAYTKQWIPYGATFLVFADYMRPTIRLAALSELRSLFIFTHDSVAVGEDGPTHQPIEHIAGLRIIPNLYTFRPADAIETAMCYYAALEKKHSPSAMLLSRQSLPVIKRRVDFIPDEILAGAYIVSGEDCIDLVLIATGSELSLAVAAAAQLTSNGISARVVSMPCRELFFEQERARRDVVIPPAARKVSIEAGCTSGWEQVTGSTGLNIGINRFGASAPADVVMEKLGLSCEGVVKKITDWL